MFNSTMSKVVKTIKSLTNKDENIGFQGYINSWILQIYRDISRNIDENFDKKYQWKKNLLKLINIGKTLKNDRRNNNTQVDIILLKKYI